LRDHEAPRRALPERAALPECGRRAMGQGNSGEKVRKEAEEARAAILPLWVPPQLCPAALARWRRSDDGGGFCSDSPTRTCSPCTTAISTRTRGICVGHSVKGQVLQGAGTDRGRGFPLRFRRLPLQVRRDRPLGNAKDTTTICNADVAQLLPSDHGVDHVG